MSLERFPGNPILEPNPHHDWETLNVFNPGVVHRDGLFHMVYRAQGSDYISHLGYAVSTDGFDWIRMDKPIFSSEGRYEVRGVEDPRITWTDQRFYMLYTGYSDYGTRVCLASTLNFITWKRYGVVLHDQDNKDAALFPEKIKGRYCMFHRIPDDIWVAYSDDLVTWTDHQIIMKPRKQQWDCTRIGAAGPPIKTEAGWLFIYHGYDEKRIYRLGAALLDAEDPAKVLARLRDPILEPVENWEISGDVPNVVFSCATVEIDDTYFVYYGGADRVIAVATTRKADLLNSLTCA